ncbi:hypothetical protein GCM10008018_61470 [Paenibacillus marchantiophytorum]|uniref:Copper amine oxidase-like N-terminal domain-containing protein n=1 Tax=Paenibacillus marchantiophytorum TaxID=1619310 RepID=A0ABQ1FER5_9BACL|nr:stalk domain-containing protein [Paenibacillus marchantiophytorum]GGA07411.1 hypothetical protein GCM10008018_61470 [Paenibacillus marchantiophytorum]
MKNLFSKKVSAIIAIVSLAVSAGTLAYADSALKQITAYQNQALKVTVNGSEVDMSSEDGTMYPVVYDGHSYVSAKAVAEAMGGSVKWNNSTQTVEITSGTRTGSGIPDKDNTTKPTPKPTAAPTPPPVTKPSEGSSNSGTVSSGVSVAYTDIYNNPYSKGQWKANYKVSVNKVTPVTAEQVVDLGFKKPDDTSTTSWALVDVTVKADNITYTQVKPDPGSEYGYISSIVPQFSGVTVADKSAKIIGVTDYGFDGSFSRNLDDALGSDRKIKPGETKSYNVSGKILVTLFKGQSNMLWIRQQDSTVEFDSSALYIKLN